MFLVIESSFSCMANPCFRYYFIVLLCHINSEPLYAHVVRQMVRCGGGALPLRIRPPPQSACTNAH